ncbi:MAG TPA: hypothetical protein VG982_01500 [Candidatus Paceibacterota bacterium]|nr:hypothetical protein [Candidatus Paceibacterota bacterium]
MFGLKKLLIRKVMERKLKDMSAGQREQMLDLVTKNPDFFNNLAKEIKAETKKGKPEMAASMEVMRRHQGELQKLMMGK